MTPRFDWVMFTATLLYPPVWAAVVVRVLLPGFWQARPPWVRRWMRFTWIVYIAMLLIGAVSGDNSAVDAATTGLVILCIISWWHRSGQRT
jgi:hypothetical protein